MKLYGEEISCCNCIHKSECPIFSEYSSKFTEGFSTINGFCYKWESNSNILEDFMRG